VVVAAVVARRALDPRATASGIMLVGLILTAVPALAAWALVGRSLATMLPSTELIIISPVSYVALAYHAVASAMILAIAAGHRKR
jgi:hypothetical protein